MFSQECYCLFCNYSRHKIFAVGNTTVISWFFYQEFVTIQFLILFNSSITSTITTINLDTLLVTVLNCFNMYIVNLYRYFNVLMRNKKVWLLLFFMCTFLSFALLYCCQSNKLSFLFTHIEKFGSNCYWKWVLKP